MHPRTQLKNDIKAMVSELLPDVPVYASRARELRPGESEAVVIYVPDETISRPGGRGESRGRRPVSRSMTVEIFVIVARPGDGEASADRADELARMVALHLNDTATDLDPAGERQEFSLGEDTRVITTMSYAYTHNDQMEA